MEKDEKIIFEKEREERLHEVHIKKKEKGRPPHNKNKNRNIPGENKEK